MASRNLDDLDSRFKPVAFELLARLTEKKLPVLIITTLRSYEEQLIAVRTGNSRTMNSLHLPQPPESKSLAIDICPFDVYEFAGPDKLLWSTADPAPWFLIGEVAESLGLRWGGRFKPLDKNGLGFDPGHCEARYLLEA